MASIDRSDPVILGHVLAEHRDLFNLMHAAQTAFTAAGPPTPERRAEICESLHMLRDHLGDHFMQEEQGGFLEEAMTRVPRLSSAVRSIVAQHPALLAELDRVIDQLTIVEKSGAGPAEAKSWSAAVHAFEAFAAHMAAHERSENAVVQEGYNEDLGLVE
jgi:iron-sulfur cluster repair protein YtfE (RIC family)